MSRHRKDPLRPLTPNERIALTRLSRSLSAPAAQVERARALRAIAHGATYTAAAHQVGRRHNETLSAWVSRFNRDGLAAVRPGHGGLIVLVRNGHVPRPPQCIAPDLTQPCREWVATVPGKVQGTGQVRKKAMFFRPRFRLFHPRDVGVLVHPAVQPLHTGMGERDTLPAPYTPERETTLLFQKGTQRPSECRALGVAPEVVADAAPQVLMAVGLSCMVRRDAHVEKCEAVYDEASVRGHTSGHL